MTKSPNDFRLSSSIESPREKAAMRIMNPRHAFALMFAFWLMLPIISPTSADDIKDDVKEGKALLDEGDKLADQGDTTEAVIRYKRAFEKLLPGMRKLPFKSEVKRDVTAREDLQAMLIKEIDAEITPGEFHASELGMKALGFIPADLDLKAVMVKIYSEEIAAFYDPKTKTMHLIKEPKGPVKKPTFLERLMGKKEGFDKDENKTVIAHELTHALADQNFDIDAMQKAIKNNDDRDLALSALIEGEATLAMTGAQMNDWDGSQSSKIPAETLERTMSFLIPFMPMAGGKALREAPVILSESMIFPYLRGMVFCAKLANHGGWEAVSDAYKRPPLSTEQVLHPDKYRDKIDYPTDIDLGPLDPGDGWKEAGRNVVGEMQIAVLLKPAIGKQAGNGWDGDTFAVFENDAKKIGLVWMSTWDSEDDARKFRRGYAAYLKKKLDEPDAEINRNLKSIRHEKDGVRYAIEQNGSDVAIVEGFTAKTTETLLEAALKAKKIEVTYENVKELDGRNPAAAK